MDLATETIPDFDPTPNGDLLGRARVAIFSNDRNSRYWLLIREEYKPLLVVCMFNPSDADEESNDPTISTLLRFARQWGYGGIIVVNLHSHVSSQPSAIRRLRADNVETCNYVNTIAWKTAINYAERCGKPVLVAWGNLGDLETIQRFARMLVGHDTVCLGTTADGRPKHPMARGLHRIPRDQKPQPFDWSVYA